VKREDERGVIGGPGKKDYQDEDGDSGVVLWKPVMLGRLSVLRLALPNSDELQGALQTGKDLPCPGHGDPIKSVSCHHREKGPISSQKCQKT
jgi:hypothetical protein